MSWSFILQHDKGGPVICMSPRFEYRDPSLSPVLSVILDGYRVCGFRIKKGRYGLWVSWPPAVVPSISKRIRLEVNQIILKGFNKMGVEV